VLVCAERGDGAREADKLLAKILKLENWLNGVARNVPTIIASHDRAFLERVGFDTVYETRDGRIYLSTLANS